MAIIRTAFTAPVNPSSATPVPFAKVWEALLVKVENPKKFVPVIASCQVVDKKTNEDGTVTIHRRVRFQGKDSELAEECHIQDFTRIDFRLEDGSSVTNFLSQGGKGPDDLYLTYTFAWNLPDVDPSDEQSVKQLTKEKFAKAQVAVETSVQVIRDLASQ